MCPRARTVALVLGFFATTPGCGSVSKERGHQEVAAIVLERSGHKTHWEAGPPSEEQIARFVDGLLEGGLTTDRAVEIALINSPSLQLVYEELGVSQADMVQAGLLSNPRIGGSIGFPRVEGQTEYEGSITQDFLSLFVLPLRKRVAREQFIADTLRVAHETLRTAAEVQKAVVALEASVKLVELQRSLTEAAEVATDLAHRQHEAGNIGNLILLEHESAKEQAKLELMRDELALASTREQVTRLLGLWGFRANWKLNESLPELPARDPSLDYLELRAIAERLDVDAARKLTFVAWNALELARDTRYVGVFDIGLHTHQDPNGPRLFGPTLSLELPIFNQRQALIARLEAQYRMADRRLAAAAVDARSEVRLSVTRLSAARATVERYRTVLIPLQGRVVSESQLQYNAMQIGLFELLAKKESQIQTLRGYLEALRDYWTARTDLELAVGGTLNRGERTAPRPAAAPKGESR